VGRDYEAIHRTAASICIIADTDAQARAALPEGAGDLFPGDIRDYGLIGTPDTIRERLAAYEAAGVQELAISFVAADQPALMRQYASEFIV
jgi:alkanesulfonate monooxygenase SsuD/methylene tetrahydromethanopterin reductase-like flavin-dependent oxidoreductase (luciferase family)